MIGLPFLGALRGIPSDQFLDLAIAKLRSVFAAGSGVPRVEPLMFHIVSLPRTQG